MRVIFADQAEADLIDIGRYIAQGSVEAALKFIGRIETICFESIAKHPEIGPRRDELIVNLRIFPVKKYVIYYRVQNEHVEIIRVLHASMDAEKELAANEPDFFK